MSIEEKVLGVIEEPINNLGISVKEVKFEKENGVYYLRISIDKEPFINIDDCVEVTNLVNPILDEHDFIDEAYILEVSSPGLGRPLKKDKDFERSLMEEVEIKLYRMKNGSKDFRGILKSYSKEQIVIEENGEDITFDRSEIALVRLAFDF